MMQGDIESFHMVEDPSKSPRCRAAVPLEPCSPGSTTRNDRNEKNMGSFDDSRFNLGESSLSEHKF
jgi:hypothetical protein